MRIIQKTIFILARPEVIWSMVSDPARAPEWMPDIRERRLLTPPPLTAGARWEEHGLLRGKPYQVKCEVTLWEPPTRMAYRQIPAGRRDYDWLETVRILPTGDGSEVTLSLEYRLPAGLAGKLYEALLFRKDFALTLENRLEALKGVLEAGGVSA